MTVMTTIAIDIPENVTYTPASTNAIYKITNNFTGINDVYSTSTSLIINNSGNIYTYSYTPSASTTYNLYHIYGNVSCYDYITNTSILSYTIGLENESYYTSTGNATFNLIGLSNETNITVYNNTNYLNKTSSLAVKQNHNISLFPDRQYNFTLYVAGLGVNPIAYIYDNVTGLETYGIRTYIDMVDIFNWNNNDKTIFFRYDNVEDYYIDGNTTKTVNVSQSEYNITDVQPYKLFLNFTDNVTGTYTTINKDSSQNRTNFTGYNLTQNLLSIVNSVVRVGFGLNNPIFTGNQTQIYEFTNDYLSYVRDEIYVMPDPDNEIFVQAFVDNSPEENVIVRLYQYVPNGSAMIVSQGLTDNEGKEWFSVEEDQQYYITYTKQGFGLTTTTDFIPRNEDFTSSTTPLILKLSKTFTTFSMGRLFFRGYNYPVFYNKSEANFSIAVLTKLDEVLYYSVNGATKQRLTVTTDTQYGHYKHTATITTPLTYWGSSVLIEIKDINDNVLESWTYTYREGRELIQTPSSILQNNTFLLILFIAIIILSGISSYAFKDENENMNIHILFVGILIIAFIKPTMFIVPTGLIVIYYITNHFKKVVSNE